MSTVFVPAVISINMPTLNKTFSEELQDLLSRTGTSVDEAVDALLDLESKVGRVLYEYYVFRSQSLHKKQFMKRDLLFPLFG